MTDTATRIPAPLGTPGLAHYGGVVSEEWDRRLRAQRGLKAYREMADSDASVGSLLYAIVSMARQTGYRIESPDDSPTADETKTYVETCFDDMQGTWGDTLSECLTCFVFGFSLMFPVYKVRQGTTGKQPSAYDDGRIGWDRWSPRSQEAVLRWVFDDEGAATAFVHVAPPTFRETIIPLDRCLHFVIRQRKGSPEGLSLLRNAYEAYTRKRGLQRIESISLERGGAGFPMARIPAEQIEENGPVLASYTKLVTQVRVDEQAGIVIPSDCDPETGKPLYDFAFISPPGTSQFNTDPVIGRADREIFRTVLADFITQGDTGVGSYAQSVNRTDLFLGAVNGLLDTVGDVINRGIRMLLTVAGIDLALCLRFTFNDVRRPDLASVASTVIGLASAGIVDGGDPAVQQYVYDLVGLPMPTAETATNPTTKPTTSDTSAVAKDRWLRQIERGAQVVTTVQPKRTVEQSDLDKAVSAFDRWVPARYRGLLEADHTEAE